MDLTACLFGFYSFMDAKLVVEDEIVVPKDYLTSDDLTSQIKAKEKELGYFSPIRIADTGNPILLADWSSKYGLAFGYPKKTDVRAMVNELRVWLKLGRVLINPRCQKLVACLKSQLWKKDAKGFITDDFLRTKAHGHGDVLSALIYMIRSVDTTNNPVPVDFGISTFSNQGMTHTINIPKQETFVGRIPKKFTKLDPGPD